MRISKLAVFFALMFAVGCASQARGMKVISAPSYAAPADMANVVFVRHTTYGFTMSFVAIDQNKRFVGSVRGKSHAIVQVPAGSYRFYVLAESTEPVHATLAAGRTYVVETRVRNGFWSVRATAVCVRRNTPTFNDAPGWIRASTPLTADGPDGQAWVDERMVNIDEKIATVEARFPTKDAEWQRAHTLDAEDGYLPGELNL